MTEPPIPNPIQYVGELTSEIDGIGSTREYIEPTEDTRKALGLAPGETIDVHPVSDDGLEMDGMPVDPEDEKPAYVVFAVRETPSGRLVAEYVAEPLAD